MSTAAELSKRKAMAKIRAAKAGKELDQHTVKLEGLELVNAASHLKPHEDGVESSALKRYNNFSTLYHLKVT